jgi:hypothetical protein
VTPVRALPKDLTVHLLKAGEEMIMKRLLSTLVATGLALTSAFILTNDASAGPPKGSGYSPKYSSNYIINKGYNYNYNYRYCRPYCPTRYCRPCDWTSWYWDTSLQCYLYWAPITRCYVYWYAPARCFYPLTAVSLYPPIAVQYQVATPGTAPLPAGVQPTTASIATPGPVTPQ